MTWKKLDCPIRLEPETIEVSFVPIQLGDISYGATRVYLRLGGTRTLPCYALMAGEDRRILPERDAEQWLLSHGLPLPLAQGLLAWANDRAQDEEEPCL